MSLSLDEDEKVVIELVSKNGKSLTIDRSYACLSKLVKNALEDKDATSVKLGEVDEDTLELIVRYLNLCKGVDIDEKDKIERILPREPKNAREYCKYYGSTWAADFIDEIGGDATTIEEAKRLVKLMTAALYMDIGSLLDLCASKYSRLAYKSPILIKYYATLLKDPVKPSVDHGK